MRHELGGVKVVVRGEGDVGVALKTALEVAASIVGGVAYPR